MANSRAPVLVVALSISGLAPLFPPCGAAALAQEQPPSPAPAPTPASGDLPPGFDPETGLWFPPLAEPDVYKGRGTADRNYMKDVMAVLAKDDALREWVCQTVASPRHAVRWDRLEPRVRQMKAMLDMYCNSVPTNREREKTRSSQIESEKALLQTWMRAASERAEAVEEANRFREESAAVAEIDAMPLGEERFKKALFVIALAPSYDRGPFLALRHASEADSLLSDGYSGRRARVTEFLEDLYRTKSSGGGPGAELWMGGRRAFLFLTGNFQEALRLSRELDAGTFRKDAPYLAVLERIAGNPEPLSRYVDECPGEGSRHPAPCQEAVAWVAWRGLNVLDQKAPRALKEILLEQIKRDPTNWPVRLAFIHAVSRVDASRAEGEFKAMLQIPATLIPEAARLDAIQNLQRLSERRGDYRAANEWIDQYVSVLGYRPGPFPQDAWPRLAALPVQPADLQAFQALQDDDWIARKLWQKLDNAIKLHDFGLAYRAFENALAYVLALGTGQEGRHRLLDLGEAEAGAGRKREALRILGYLAAQPVGDYVNHRIEVTRRRLSSPVGDPVELKPASTPWDAQNPTSTRLKVK